MNQIVIEGPLLTSVRLQAKDIDDAIKQLHELKGSQKRAAFHSIRQFKGIVNSTTSLSNVEEEWYLQ